MAPAGTRLLRYIFDNGAQLQSHAHGCDGRTLLYFPDRALHTDIGAPVLLELAFVSSEQSVTIPGRVHARDAAGGDGAWLELFAPRLAEEVRLALGKPDRRFRRLSTDRMVRVATGQGTNIARLLDVGLGGVRLGAVSGSLSEGEELRISEVGRAEQVRAKVIWARSGDVAVEFVRSDASARAGATRFVSGTMEQWATARTVRHPAMCGCDRGGAVLEPLLPRTAHRRQVAP